MKHFSARWSGGFRHLRQLQGGWTAFIYFIVTLVLSIALSPKPPKPKAAALEDFDIPVAEEDRPIPVVFGTVRITGANVTWFGDLRTTKIKKSGLTGSTTIGYKYYLGMHMALGHGPFDAVTKIEVGDKEAWTGNLTANGTATINKPDLFGGKSREGGIVGSAQVEFGASDQSVNAYLAAQQGTPTPAYRGVTCIVWSDGAGQGGYIGNTPYVKPWAVTVRRILSGWTNDSAWYPAAATIGTAMNPAHIIYQALTDIEWGMGSPTGSIDETSFIDAADTLFAEGFGLNLLWNQSTSIEQFIQIVLDHIAGILAFDQSTGKYLLKLVRADYDADALQTFDPSNVIEVQNFERRAWGETVNELTLTFTDATTRKPTAMVVQDLGNIASQGGVRIAEKVDFSGVDDLELIRSIAGRELAARSTPLARMDLITDRTLWRYGPGDVIKVRWPQYELEETVFRILNLRRGTLKDGKMAVSVVEDIYGLPGIEYAEELPAPDVPVPPFDPEEPDGNPNVQANNLSSPPLSPSDGERYYIPVSPAATGAWAGHEGEIAEWDDTEGAWIFVSVPTGTPIYNEDDGTHFTVDEYGEIAPPPWTPAIPGLTEEEEPDPEAFMLVGYHTSNGVYRKFKPAAIAPTVVDIPIAGFVAGAPSSSEVLLRYVLPQEWSAPVDLLGTQVHLGTDPAATYTLSVRKNTVEFGTIQISSAGAVTLASTGTTFAVGDVLEVVCPSSTDANAADLSVSIVVQGQSTELLEPTLITTAFFFAPTPGTNELIYKHVAAVPITFPANFAGSLGSVGTNPTGTFDITVSVGGATVGNINISTGGAFSFTTENGEPISVLAGELIEFEAPGSADATIANISVTLFGTIVQ